MIHIINVFFVFFFFKQKTAYEMRISDWSSDVCSSDLVGQGALRGAEVQRLVEHGVLGLDHLVIDRADQPHPGKLGVVAEAELVDARQLEVRIDRVDLVAGASARSEEHTSELQSLMRISYAVFCLKKKKET